jgi:glutamate carboxypeptidase
MSCAQHTLAVTALRSVFAFMNIDTPSLKAFFEAQLPAGLEMLRQMVNVNSFTSNREGVNRLGKLTADFFAPLGFQAEFVPSSNAQWGNHLVMTRPGRSNRTVAMVSHLDTVFPPEEEIRNDFHWQVEGDRIFGPGTLDIKGGTVMMWLVLQALQAKAPEQFEDVTWKFFCNSSEECLSPDFDHVCRKRLPASTLAMLVFEAENRLGSDRLMVAARKGRLTWKVTVKGRSAHAGGNLKQGASAVLQLARLVQRIEAMTDFSKELTFNVGRVSGGTVLNRVPHEAVAEGEFRAFNPMVCEEAKAKLLALAGTGDVRSPADDYPCQVAVEITSESRAWPRNQATDRLLNLWIDSARELGTSVVGEERGGLSDGNSFWDTVPTLDGLGPWGDNDHCSERSPDGSKLPEFVESSSFVPKAMLNTVSILKLLR